MSQFDKINDTKINDTEQKKEGQREPREYVLIPKEEAIQILKSLDGLKRKLQPFVNKTV
jgi:hypothetical protein